MGIPFWRGDRLNAVPTAVTALPHFRPPLSYLLDRYEVRVAYGLV
jgi:hypothetical protein